MLYNISQNLHGFKRLIWSALFFVLIPLTALVLYTYSLVFLKQIDIHNGIINSVESH